MTRVALALIILFGSIAAARADEPKPLKLLFLGDNGHHRPNDRFRQIQPVLAKRGIAVEYTDKADALNPATLAKYDGLILYANIDEITPKQESALLDYVASGKGFIPLHCASYCFRNSSKVVDLIGAQFLRHGTGTFRTTIAQTGHPLMKGFKGFESWDETYVHTKHNEKDRTVLEYRDEGGKKEPWTWVRTHGKGRVFYTAWGHDDRTWGNPGFQNLVERGIRWACGQDPAVVPVFAERPEMTKLRTDVKPFEYVPAKVPFYPPSPRWGVTAEPIAKMQKPLPADESMKHMVTPVDFEVKLFVDETKLGGGKPICMNWDERGRLWVALTYDYPNERKPDGEGRDRIVICEDTDGDGVCDKVTVFADKLSIPTSILPYAGGVIVHQAPHTLFLKDTKGTGQADFRQILFTGWGTGDTHAGPSNLRYGLDNWIYGMVGYSAFRGEVNGERVDFRQGLYRFKVEANPARQGGGDVLKVTKLEFLRSTSNNSWGVGISEDGQLFGSTANGCPLVHMPIPNRQYEKVRGLSPSVLQNIAPDNHFEPITTKVRQVDFHGGFTAAAGSAIYTARNYPREYWNRTAFVCEPTGHLVAAFVLEPDGATFKAKYGWNLLASDDEWTAPIMAEVGPDGNVWVLDWYNFIVQHNPTPPGFKTGKGAAYETDLRDKKHGRIYRIVPKNAKPLAALQLDKTKPGQLVETLKNDNMFWRLQAQRLLVERGKDDIVSQLHRPLKVRALDAAWNAAAVHALSVLQGLNAIHEEELQQTAVAAGLVNPSPAVRRRALEVLSCISGGPRWLRFELQGDAGRRQLEEFPVPLALAISEMPQQQFFGTYLVKMLQREERFRDRSFRDAFVIAAAAHARAFLGQIANTERLPAFASSMLEPIAARFAATSDREAISALLIQLADAGPPAEAFFAERYGQSTEAVLSALAAGWPSGKRIALTSDAESAVAKMIARSSASSRGKLLRLASLWGVKGIEAQLAEITKGLFVTLANAKSSDDARIDAARQLAALKPEDDAAAAQILSAVKPQSAPALATGLFDALSASTARGVGAAVAARLLELPPAARTAAVRLVLSRTEWTKALLDAAEAGKVGLDLLSLDQRVALSTHSDAGLAKRAKAILAKGGGLPDADRQKVIDQFLPQLKKAGDAAAGKLVFKNNCAKCHRHSGEGEQIGPDLTGVAVHTKEHLIVDILDPSRNVEGNFRIWRVDMKDGRTFNGLLVAETKTSVELVDSEAKRYTLQRADIEELTASAKSLMPEGFEKTLKPDDLVNLLEFLTQKGKYLPIPLDKAATVVSTKGMFYSEDAAGERLVFRDWAPKTFDGVPFYLIDPKGDTVANVVLLNSPNGAISRKMPKSVTLPCNAPAKAIHFLSGVSGWGFPYSEKGAVSMIVRLHYADGQTEDHPLKNGEQFADYIRRVDVPGSQFAFALRGQQIRYLAVAPKRAVVIKEIELTKGPDATAPVVMAVTVETP